MPGLDPGIHDAFRRRSAVRFPVPRFILDCRVIRALTPVFDGLSPAMTVW